MIIFLIILLNLSIVIFDFIPTKEKVSNKKAYSIFYISTLIFSSTILILKVLDFKIIGTFDIIRMFQ